MIFISFASVRNSIAEAPILVGTGEGILDLTVKHLQNTLYFQVLDLTDNCC